MRRIFIIIEFLNIGNLHTIAMKYYYSYYINQSKKNSTTIYGNPINVSVSQ